MEAHVVNQYLNQRIKNLELRKKNLAIKERNYSPEEKTKHRVHYESEPIEERIRFSQEQRENTQKFNNQMRTYDAIKNYQSGVTPVATDDQDTRTTMEKFNDIQFVKDSAYKYAFDLLRDKQQTARFMQEIMKHGDMIIGFVQNYGLIKQKMTGTQLLGADQLIQFMLKFGEQLRDSSYANNILTAERFNTEMKKYKPPGTSDLAMLQAAIEKLKTVDPLQVQDLLLRIDAIGRLTAEMKQKQLDIESSLPNKTDIEQLKQMSEEIRTSMDAADFLEKAKNIMESVTKTETTRIMTELQNSNQQVNERLNMLNNQLQTYIAPTASELVELKQKVNQLITTKNKPVVLQKIEALTRAVNQLPSNIVDNINVKLPSQEDIQSLLSTRDVEFKQQISNVLSSVNQSAIAELLSDHTSDIKQHVDRKLDDFEQKMEKYVVPSQSELVQLRNRIENMQTASVQNKNDLLLKVEALGSVVSQLNDNVVNINTNVPSKEELSKLLASSQEEFDNKVSTILAGIDKTSLEELLSSGFARVENQIGDLSNQFKQYVVPSMESLEALHTKINNNNKMTAELKQELLQKTEMLGMMVNELETRTVDAITNLPSKQDIESLVYEEVKEEELPAKAEAKLKSVTPEAVEKVKTTSGTLKAFLNDQGKFDINKLINFRSKNSITQKNTNELYRNFIAAAQEEDVDDMAYYYKYTMYSLGFKLSARSAKGMYDQMRSDRVLKRMRRLGLKPVSRVNKPRTQEEKTSSEILEAVSVVQEAADKNKDIFNDSEEKQSGDDSETVGMF